MQVKNGEKVDNLPFLYGNMDKKDGNVYNKRSAQG